MYVMMGKNMMAIKTEYSVLVVSLEPIYLYAIKIDDMQ